MTSEISSETLDALRGLADESLRPREFDDLVGSFGDGGPAQVLRKVSMVHAIAKMGTKSQAGMAASGIELDQGKLRLAQTLFARYGTEISGALLLAALPQTYATGFGSRVLMRTGRLRGDLVRRIRGTAQFLAIVTQQVRDDEDPCAGWKVEGNRDVTRPPKPWAMCAALRAYHEKIRRDLDTSVPSDMAGPEVPLNQEDLIGTLLTFTISVFEVLERFGIRWTTEEQQAYLHLWDVVGAHLGIGTPEVFDAVRWKRPSGWQGLRPWDIHASRLLLQTIRSRQWLDHPDELAPAEWKSGRDGRVLLAALLDEVRRAMPPQMRSWPLAVMRQLAEPIVRDRLQLGAGGFVMSSLAVLPRRETTIGWFTSQQQPNPMEARVLRMMSNEVTRRTLVRFVSQGEFVLPGLEAWMDGLHVAPR